MKVVTKTIPLVALLTLLSACSSPKEATESNFRKVLNDNFETKDCAGITLDSPQVAKGIYRSDLPDAKEVTKEAKLPLFYAYANPSQAGWNEDNAQRELKRYNALVKVGLLSAKEKNIPESYLKAMGQAEKTIQGIEYSLTEVGTKLAYTSSNGNVKFCAAHYKVDEIKNFTQPADVMGMHVTEVRYVYSPANIADWAKNEEIKRTFPALQKSLEGKQEAKEVFILTNKGWSQGRP
ncbi:MAG: hypothetical protein WDW21_05055 [Neisseriaceae bacterium]